MTNTFTASFERCRHHKPLVVLDEGIFRGVEMRPQQLRDLAAHLMEIAALAERLPTGLDYVREQREYRFEN
jgi:hypothetical protein